MIVEPADAETESLTNAEHLLDKWQPGWRQLSELDREHLVEDVVFVRMLFQGLDGRV